MEDCWSALDCVVVFPVKLQGDCTFERIQRFCLGGVLASSWNRTAAWKRKLTQTSGKV